MLEREFFWMSVKKLMELVSAICSSGEEMVPILRGWAAIQVSVFFLYLQCNPTRLYQQVFTGHLLDARRWDDSNKQAELVSALTEQIV